MPEAQTSAHRPMRTCVACRSTSPKEELVRLVHERSGAVSPDPCCRAPGRGIYLCRKAECWESALRKGRLERAIRGRLTLENRNELTEFSTRFQLEHADVNWTGV